MINMRIAVVSMVTFVVLLGVISFVADNGYDKVIPKIEAQKQKAKEQQLVLNKYMRENLEDLGASLETNGEDINEFMQGEYPDFQLSARQLRPIGTWMGIRKDDSNKIAIMKFDKRKYWLLIKDQAHGDFKEKGEYEYQITMIYFKPDNKPAYYMDYFMASKDGIQLYGNDFSYTFERDDNITLKF